MSTDENLPFFEDLGSWCPPEFCYPTWDDAVRFYLSRVHTPGQCHTSEANLLSHSEATRELSLFLYKIWGAGDGCPKTAQNIAIQFDTEVLPIYKKYRKGEGRISKSHKKKTKTVVVQPKRKSRRLHSSSVNEDVDIVSSNENNFDAPETVGIERRNDNLSETKVNLRKKGGSINANRVHWLEDHGKKLFDIFSKQKLEQIIATKSGAFDSEFYLDQKDPEKRKLVIKTMHITRQYYEEQKAIQMKKARQFERQLSATKSVVDMYVNPEEYNLEEVACVEIETEPDFSLQTPTGTISASSMRSSTVTRRSLSLSSPPERTFVNVSTQTKQLVLSSECDVIPSISTRKQHSNRQTFSSLVHPAYLQSGALMMSVNTMSAQQAVMAMYIHDTQVYNQERILPLSMQKKYQRQLNLLKKINKSEDTTEDSMMPDNEEITEEECDQIVINETEIESEPKECDQILINETELDSEQPNLKEGLARKKSEHKKNLYKVLPEPRTVRNAHHNISCYLEGKIGKEMLASGKTFLMPDGTSRQKLGRIGASLVDIEGKMRSLKMQWMGNEKRDNWADTIIFQLKRLAVASSSEVGEIYKTILSIVSDACKVNKGLGAEISSKLGLSWIPGALYCCIHTVLGFQDGIKDVWMRYQSDIGHKKMYPSVTGFELDMEDSCLVKQILEAFLRLTADRWQARSWNKYEEYNNFCMLKGITNKAKELHGNRFGDLELCSAIGVYSLPTWIEFIEAYPNIRNQLSIFLRDTMHLSDICRILWLGAALFGIHVTFPYLRMLLDLEVNHLQLLKILPAMHLQLVEYPKSLAQVREAGVEALSFAWLDPLNDDTSPYGKVVCGSLLCAIECCDLYLLDRYLRELCYKEGAILKRQRGNAYGFGDDVESEEHVLKQLSPEDLKRAPTHTKQIENLYGTEDMILTRFGTQAFNKSQDDMIIKYSSDLLDKSHNWNTKKMRKCTKELDDLQKEFTESQKSLVNAGVTPAEAIQLTSQNKIHRVVEQCRKSHNGPITTEEELDAMLVKFDDQQLKRKALIYEIRYRKFTFLNIKDSNPLFLQKKLTDDKLESNLRLLLQKCCLSLASTATMEDLEKVIFDGPKEMLTPECVDIPEVSLLTDKDISTTIETISAEGIQTDTREVTPSTGPLAWPLKLGDHIAVNFDTGFYIGEVIKHGNDENQLLVSYMSPKTVTTADGAHPMQFWVWGKEDTMWTDRECILPIYPVLELAIPPTTLRCLVFKLENMDFVAKFANL